MISENMKELVKGSSTIRAMFEEGKRLAAIHGAENVYDFSLGNPCVSPPEHIVKSILNILENENPMTVHGYMANAGFEDSRAKIAASLNREFKTNFGHDNLIMTVGAAGALNIAFKTLLNPNDEVIVFAPYFGEYKRYIENYQGKMITVSADTENFQINLEEFADKVNKNTKAVIINSPNNPSGAIYSEETLKSIAGILEEKQTKFSTSIYLLSDEPYRKIVYDDAKVPYVSKFYKNTLVAYSFSKALSLPGERIGFLVVPTEADSYDEIMAGLIVANRILGFVNAPSLFQRVAADCIDTNVDVTIYEENRNILYDSLSSMGYTLFKPQGAFYLFPQSLEQDDVSFCSRAKEYNLLLVPGSAFGCGGHFRIAYCTAKSTIMNSLHSFESLAKSYR